MRAPWEGDAKVLDGAACARQIKDELRARVEVLRAHGVVPGLGTILVGEDPGSVAYVAGKHRDCAEVGIESIPLPRGVDTNRVLEAVDPDKDADGLHPTNLGRLVLRGSEPIHSPLPCTPRAVIELIQRNGIDLSGADVCVVGRGVTVGRSIGLLLTRKDINATVTICHTGTRDLAAHTRAADVVVAATGYAGLITADMVRPGAVVLDVGVSRVVDPESGKARLMGDIADGVDRVAGWLSPNPGGVGPMTRALLLMNVVEAAERGTNA